MCKCEVGECVYAKCEHIDTGIIECEKEGNVIPKRKCDEFVQFVEINDDDTTDNYSKDAHIKCPKCNAVNDLYDIPFDEYIEVICEECGNKFICEYYYD